MQHCISAIMLCRACSVIWNQKRNLYGTQKFNFWIAVGSSEDIFTLTVALPLVLKDYTKRLNGKSNQKLGRTVQDIAYLQEQVINFSKG
jgi:hypothetical protein